jgi:hypothetical protein
MTNPRVLLSTRPEAFGYAAQVATGVEVKLDWRHAASFSDAHTLLDRCNDAGLPPENVVSVHLPPGTNRRHGMSAADGNAGPIAAFVHDAFGDAIDPEWLTLHSARSFEYHDQLHRLATLAELTGYPVSLENTPDRSDLYTPEDLAAFGLLVRQRVRSPSASLVVDTAHVAGRRRLAIDDEAVARVLDRTDPSLRARVDDALRATLREHLAGADLAVPPDDPWRPALVTLAMVGGAAVRAVHLNEPDRDGVPSLDGGPSNGLDEVVAFCRAHDITVVLEPDHIRSDRVTAALEWLETELA